MSVSELLLVFFVAMIVLGPKQMIPVARSLGRGWGWLRRQQWKLHAVFDEQYRLAQLEDNQKRAEQVTLAEEKKVVSDES